MRRNLSCKSCAGSLKLQTFLLTSRSRRPPSDCTLSQGDAASSLPSFFFVSSSRGARRNRALQRSPHVSHGDLAHCSQGSSHQCCLPSDSAVAASRRLSTSSQWPLRSFSFSQMYLFSFHLNELCLFSFLLISLLWEHPQQKLWWAPESS